MIKNIDKQIYSILTGFYFIYIIIIIIKKYNLWNKNSYLKKFSLLEYVGLEVLIQIIVTIPLVVIITYLTKKMLREKIKIWGFFIIHILTSIITAFIFSSLYYLLFYFLRSKRKTNLFDGMMNSVIGFSNTHFLFYSVIVFIVFSFYYANKLQLVEIQKLQIKEQLANTKVNILKYQLHPHFFFNTFNSISSLMEIDTKLAQNTLADFSDLLRDITSLKDVNVLPLNTEIKILKKYVDIMSVRFSDCLKININIQSGLENINVPSLILQPIVENSIKYGYSYEVDNLEINIFIQSNNRYIYLIVENNGESLKKNYKLGDGLDNTQKRLATLFPGNFIFKMENLTNKRGVRTTIAFSID